MSEKEKKKREEDARNIISNAYTLNTINSINYARAKNYNIETQNEDEKEFINKVNEANNIINSINPRNNVPAPSISKDDEVLSKQNAQSFVNLIDNNKTNIVLKDDIDINSKVKNNIVQSKENSNRTSKEQQKTLFENYHNNKTKAMTQVSDALKERARVQKEKEEENKTLISQLNEKFKKQTPATVNTSQSNLSNDTVKPKIELANNNEIKNLNVLKTGDMFKLTKGLTDDRTNLQKSIDDVTGVAGNLVMGIEGAIPATVKYLNKLGEYSIEKHGAKVLDKLGLEGLPQEVLDEMIWDKLWKQTPVGNLNSQLNSKDLEKWRKETINNNIQKTSNPLTKKLAELAPSIGENTAMMTVSSVCPLAGTVLFMTSAAGNYLDDAEKRGMNKDQALAYATIMGIFEGGSEAVISGNMVSKAKKLITGTGISQEILNSYGIDLAENFVQESIMEPLQEATAQLVGGKDTANWDNIGQRMLESGIDGVLSAIILSGASVGIVSAENIVNNPNATDRELQMALTETINSGKVNINDIVNGTTQAMKDGKFYINTETFFINENIDFNNVNVKEVQGTRIELVNDQLNIVPAVVKNDSSFIVIDAETGLKLDTTNYHSQTEAIKGFDDKIRSIDISTINSINNKIVQSKLALTSQIKQHNTILNNNININENPNTATVENDKLYSATKAKQILKDNNIDIDLNNRPYLGQELNYIINRNTTQTSSKENTSTFYSAETNYAVQDIKKVIEPFKAKQEYTRNEIAEIWNNEISENEYDVLYDNNRNIQSYIAIEEDGKNIVVNQYDNNDNVIKSEVIPSKNGKYTSKAIKDTIEKVASVYDENKPIKGQVDIEGNEVKSMKKKSTKIMNNYMEKGDYENKKRNISPSNNANKIALDNTSKTNGASASIINNSITQNDNISKSLERFKSAKGSIDRQDIINIANSLNIKVKKGAHKIIDVRMQRKSGHNLTPQIVDITKLFENVTNNNVKKFRKQAMDKALELYRDEVVNIKDTESLAEINKSGIKETYSTGLTKEKIQSSDNIKEIIEEGIYDYTTQDDSDINKILYHHYFSPVNYEGTNGLIRVVIKEFPLDKTSNDKFYYHQIEYISGDDIIKEGSALSYPTINSDNKTVELEPSIINNSISQKNKSVKNDTVINKDMQKQVNYTSENDNIYNKDKTIAGQVDIEDNKVEIMKKNTSNNYHSFKDLIKQEETKALSDFNPSVEIKIPENIQKIKIKDIKQSEAIKLAKNTFTENNTKRTFKNYITGNKIKVIADDIKESIYKTFSNKNQKKYLKESIASFAKIDSIIENGKKVSESTELKNRSKYKNWNYYITQALINDKAFLIEFDAALQADGWHFRVERLKEINKKVDTPLATTTKKSMPIEGKSTIINNSITQKTNSVKNNTAINKDMQKQVNYTSENDNIYNKDKTIAGQVDIEGNEVRNMKKSIKTDEQIREIVKYNQDGREIKDQNYVDFMVKRYKDNKNISTMNINTTFAEKILEENTSKNDKLRKLYAQIDNVDNITLKTKIKNAKTQQLEDVNLNVDITLSGIRESFSKSNNIEKYAIVPYLDKLIETVEDGDGYFKVFDDKQRENVKGFFYLFNTAKINDKLYAIKMDIKRTELGDRFYVHRVSLINNEEASIQASDLSKSYELVGQEASSINDSIPQKTESVKSDTAINKQSMQKSKNNTSKKPNGELTKNNQTKNDDNIRYMKKENRQKESNEHLIKSVDDIESKYKKQVDYMILNEDADYINLRNLVIKEELRNKGIGQNILNDIIDYANQTEKIITLTPTNAFNTKSRLKQWYKRNGFVENSGKNANFIISDTMYKLPENNNIQKSIDNQGRELSKQQQEYFKDSKVRDENGNLKTLYHGTPYDFNIFNYDKLGENTSSLGAGFYFTDSRKTGEEYRRGNGNLKEVYVNITKPLSYGKTTMSKKEYKTFVEAINQETKGTYLEDYGGIDEAIMEYDYGGDDIDLVNAVHNASGLSWKKTFDILRNTIGFDGIISEKGYLNENETIYVAFNSNQIKNIDNANPTVNEDIRFAKRTVKNQTEKTNAERADAYIEQEIRKIEKTGNWDESIPITKRSDIRKTIEDYLGLNIKKGKFRQQAYGIYKSNRDVIRTKEYKDMDTILHEVGHALDLGNRIKVDKNTLGKELITAINKLDGYEKETRRVKLDEGFAEVIREYTIIPEQAKAEYPQTVAVLEELRQKDTDFNKFIQKVQEQTYNYIHQSPRNRELSNMSIGEQTDKKPLTKEWVKQEVMRNVYDSDYVLKSVQNEIAKRNGKTTNSIKASNNIYLLTRLANASYSKAINMLSEGYIDLKNEKTMPGLNKIGEILGNNPERYNDLRAYLVAQRDLEYKAKTLKTGLRSMDSKTVIEQFKNDTQIQEAAQIVYDTLDGVLQYAVDNHLIDEKMAENLRESNTFYVPMQRVLENKGNNIGHRGAVTDIIKKRTGSELDVKDVLENIIANSANIIQQVDNNNALKALYNQGEEAGITGSVYDVIDTPMVKVGTANLSTWESELKKQGVDTTKLDLEKTIDIFAPNQKVDSRNLITSFIDDNGKRVYLQFNDELVFNAITGMDKEFMSKVLKINSKLNMPLRYGATMANLGFAIPNMISDTAQATIYSTAGFIPVIDNAIGVLDVLTANNKSVQKFMNQVAPDYVKKVNLMYSLYNQSGASSSTRMSQYRKSTQETMEQVYGTNSKNLSIEDKFKPLKRLLDLMTYIPEISEQSTRLRVFEKNYDYYKSKGSSEMDARIQAAIESRDATQDFGRSGNLTREINQLIPFSAARVGSAYTFAEKVSANPKQVCTRIAVLTAIAMAIKAIRYDDDEIEELNQRKKDDNFILKIGDNVVTIKKPQGILRSIINLAEYIQDLATGHIKEGREGERLGEWLNNAIMDNMPADSITGLVPNAVAPLIENAINKDFYYNTDIVKSYDLELPDSEQYYDYNSQLAIWLGKIFNYSPAKIDNLISGYFAGLGTSITDAMDYTMGKLGIIPEQPEMGAEDNTIGKRFIVNVNSNSASIDELYNKKTELTKKKNVGTITEEETTELETINDAISNLAKLNKQIKEIKKDLSMSGKEKANEIKLLQQEKTDTARKALEKKLIYPQNENKIQSTQFYPSDTLKKNGYTLSLNPDMKKEYEQIAIEYYSKYESQGIYSKEKLKDIKTKAKDYAKNAMFQKYKSDLIKSNK